jgi:hypothetical protein
MSLAHLRKMMMQNAFKSKPREGPEFTASCGSPTKENGDDGVSLVGFWIVFELLLGLYTPIQLYTVCKH